MHLNLPWTSRRDQLPGVEVHKSSLLSSPCCTVRMCWLIFGIQDNWGLLAVNNLRICQWSHRMEALGDNMVSSKLKWHWFHEINYLMKAVQCCFWVEFIEIVQAGLAIFENHFGLKAYVNTYIYDPKLVTILVIQIMYVNSTDAVILNCLKIRRGTLNSSRLH